MYKWIKYGGRNYPVRFVCRYRDQSSYEILGTAESASRSTRVIQCDNGEIRPEFDDGDKVYECGLNRAGLIAVIREYLAIEREEYREWLKKFRETNPEAIDYSLGLT